jgi:hypothetical protein
MRNYSAWQRRFLEESHDPRSQDRSAVGDHGRFLAGLRYYLDKRPFRLMGGCMPFSPRVVRKSTDENESCHHCGELAEQGLFGSPTFVTGRGVSEVYLYPLCRVCFEVDAATIEAQAKGYRFTHISPFKEGTRLAHYFGSRCPCGRPSLQFRRPARNDKYSGWCNKCVKEARMLDKLMAESRMLGRLIQTIKQESKNGTQHQ